MEKRELIPRIARWWLRIQEFDIDIVHRAGTQMNHVDAISRAPFGDAREMDTASLKIAKTIIDEEDWLFYIQLQDEKIQKIVADIKLKKKSENDEYVIEEDGLFRKHGNNLLWVVPRLLRFHILHECDDKAGHVSTDKTMARILNLFWFTECKTMSKAISNPVWAVRFIKHQMDVRKVSTTTMTSSRFPFPRYTWNTWGHLQRSPGETSIFW